VYEVIIRR